MAIYSVEKGRGGNSPFFSWRAIFAGLFVSVFVYAVLMALGTAIGAATAEGLLKNQSGDGSGLALGTGIWFIISGLISVGAGAYVASRICNFQVVRVGRTQGFLVASVFFSFFLFGIGSTVGALGTGASALVGSVAGGAANVSQNNVVQDSIRQALSKDMNLKSPPDQVAQGIVTHLVRGDTEGAKTYLSQQSNLSRAEIDARFNQVLTDSTNKLRDVGKAAADAVSKASWVLFAMLVLGGICGAIGGAMGARANLHNPLMDEVHITEEPPTSRVA